MNRPAVLCLAAGLLLSLRLFGAGTEVVLAENGRAKFPIIVSPTAGPGLRVNAKLLAEYLTKITAAEFRIEEGDGSHGIVLGTAGDFSALPKSLEAAAGDPRRTEEYLLHSHENGLLLVGRSDLAAQNAVWDFLGRLGYRQYFPGPVWEIIPSVPRLAVAYDEIQKPDYLMRKIWYSAGTTPERQKMLLDWEIKNRMPGGVSIQVAHSYQGIVSRHEETFRSHPEYFAMVDGKREFSQSGKLNVANSELRKLVVEDRLEELRKNPEQSSVSIDPSDGGGWDESSEAKALGSVSDQAILLANEVAESVEKEFPGRTVGLYAYAFHSDPPTIRVRANVAVFVTTAFRRTPLTLKQQMEGWANQGATIGIRDYLSVPIWDYDLPSLSRVSAWRQFAKNWRDYHQWGARYYTAESSDNWGIMGLVYYAASRMLWNVNDTAFLDGMLEDFLTKCFGPVADDIRPYYRLLLSRPIVGEDLIHRLYSAIQAAREKNPSPAIGARLDELALYVRYLELSHRYANLQGEERRQGLKDIALHLYRGRFHVVDSVRGIMRSLARESGLEWDRDQVLAFRRGVPLWAESAAPYTHEEILPFVTEGLKNNSPLGYETVSYSNDLVPAAPLFSGDNAAGEFGTCSKKALYYTWAEAPGTSWNIRVTNHGDTARTVKAELWAAAEELQEKTTDEKSIVIEPGKSGEIQITSPQAGRHWIFLSGQKLGDSVELDPTKPWTITSVPEAPIQSMAYMKPSNTVYFYVPKGTRLLGLYAHGEGLLMNPDGELVKSIGPGDGYLKFDVTPGTEGRLWSLKQWRGATVQLLTVPSYFARSSGQLLLPREVVEADRLAK